MWDHESARSVRGIVRGLRHDIGDFAIQNVLLEDVERDFALLQVEPDKKQIPYELVGQEPKFGKELTIAGSFIPAEKRGRGHFNPEMQAVLGYYSKITPFLEEYGDTLHKDPRELAELLDLQTLVMGRQKPGHDGTFKGMSGSPILQSSRKAVGILFAAMGQYDVGTSAQALIEALEGYDGTVGPTLDEYFGKTKLLSGQRGGGGSLDGRFRYNLYFGEKPLQSLSLARNEEDIRRKIADNFEQHAIDKAIRQRDIIEEIQNKSFDISFIEADGYRAPKHGSGFALSDNRIVTNFHVIRYAWDQPGSKAGIVAKSVADEPVEFTSEMLMGYDTEKDLAMFRVPSDQNVADYYEIGAGPYLMDDKVVSLGRGGSYMNYADHISTGKVQNMYMDKDYPLYFGTDTFSESGMSGSATLDADLKVYGVHAASDDTDPWNRLAMMTSPRAFRDFVERMEKSGKEMSFVEHQQLNPTAAQDFDTYRERVLGTEIDRQLIFHDTKLLSGQRGTPQTPLTFEGYDVDDIEVMLEDWRGGESLIKEQIQAIEKYYQHIGQAMPPVREPYGAAATPAPRVRDYGTPGKDLEDLFKQRKRSTPARSATDFENYTESEIDQIISLMERGAEITAEQHAVVVAYNQQANERSAKVAGETAARVVETVADAAAQATQQQPRRQATQREIESEIDRLNREMDMAEGGVYTEEIPFTERADTGVDQRNIDFADAAAQSDIEDTIDTTYDPQAFSQPDIDDTETVATASMEYTENQLKAIGHREGPGLVIAGPGAGKTAVLRGRVEDLVGSGVNLRNILTLAYNTDAKDELIKRLRHLGAAQVETLHGFAYRVVRENLSEAGFEYTPKVPQAKRGETLERFISDMLQIQNEGRAVDPRTVKEIAGEIDVLRSGITEGRFDPDMLQGEARAMATAYEVFKRDNNIVDFHDMLEIAGDLLESYPTIRAGYQRQYPYLQVDEFQDVAPADMRILSQLTPNLFAVGDDDQSIYRFRGADATVMRDFRAIADEYDVTANFRSRPEIVEAANRIVEGSRKRIPKELVSTRDPGGSVRYVESNPYDVFKKLQAELKEGQETALLVRTQHEERELMNFLLEMPELAQDVTVSTMHSAKGLEFDKVIVLLNTLERSGGLYRSFPTANTPEELEEERRLFYVATTRAKEELVYMGREEKFLRELGFEPESQRTPPPQETARTVKDMEVQSKGIADFFGNLFHRFRAHYQRVRTYQDMVEMERDLPVMNIVENIELAQLHRSKVEDMGRDLGIEPAARSERPAKMRMVDRLLGSLHKPGRMYAGGMAAALTTGQLFPPTDPFTSFGLYTLPLALGKVARKIDESLYPHAIRPESLLNYRQLFIEIPDRVRENLPDDILQSALDEHGELRNWRFVQSRAEGTYQPVFYEFPDPAVGWEGESMDRPLFDMWGRQMNRMPQEELEALDAQGLRSVTDTSLDTSDPSKNLQIRPYSEFGYEDIYEPPKQPRSADELSGAVKDFMVKLRGYVAENQIGARRPRWRDDWFFRYKWDKNHRQALRRIDKFLIKNLNNDIINFQHAARVLDRMHRSRSPISMGAESGVHDVGGAVNAMHIEVLDHLEKVWNERSPYHTPSRWITAGGKFHKLPDGTMADVEQEPVTHTPKPRTRDRLRGMFTSDTTRKPKGLERFGLMIQTFDELGEEINIGSGAYLGDGKVGTALHTFQGVGQQMPTRAVARTLTGDQEIDITGFLNYDPDLDLAIVQLDEASEQLKDLRAAPLGRRSRAGRRVDTMGVAQLTPDADPTTPYRSRTTVSESSSRMGMLGAQTPFFPMQSGSGVYGRGLFGFLRPRLQGIFTGAGKTDKFSPERGFFAPVEQLRSLMESGEFTAFGETIGDITGIGERDLLEITNKRLRELGKAPEELRGERQRSLRMLLERDRMPYLAEIAEIESLLTDLESQNVTLTPDQLLGFDQATGMPLAPDEVAGASRTVEGQHINALLETVREANKPAIDEINKTLEILNDPRNTRAADFGRAVRGTRFEGAARLGAGALESMTQFIDSPGMGKLGRALARTGKVLGIGLEGLDWMDKLDYFTGTADARIAANVVAEGDSEKILDRYIATVIQQDLYDSGISGMFTGLTDYEREYLDLEGGLKPLLDTEIAGGKPFRWLGEQPGLKQIGGLAPVKATGNVLHGAVLALDTFEKTMLGRTRALSDTTTMGMRREQAQQLDALRAKIDVSQLSDTDRESYERYMTIESEQLTKDLEKLEQQIYTHEPLGGAAAVWGAADRSQQPLSLEGMQQRQLKMYQRRLDLVEGYASLTGTEFRTEDIESMQADIQRVGSRIESGAPTITPAEYAERYGVPEADAPYRGMAGPGAALTAQETRQRGREVVTTGLKIDLPPIPQRMRPIESPSLPKIESPSLPKIETPPIIAQDTPMSDPQAQVLGANILMATDAQADMSEMFFDASDAQRQQVVGDIQQQPKGTGLHFAAPREGQPFIIIKGRDAVVDGDTIKGVLHAFGEEALVKIRMPTIDAAETDPGFMDRRFGRQTERSKESIEREKRIAQEQKKYLQDTIMGAIAGSDVQQTGTRRGQFVVPGYEDKVIGDEISESVLKRGVYEESFILPVGADYIGQRGKMGRPLADIEFTHTETGAKMSFGEIALASGKFAAYQHDMSYGAPMHPQQKTYSADEREAARKFYEKYRKETRLTESQQRVVDLQSEIETFTDTYKRKTDKTYGLYTAEDLRGYISDLAGTDDAPGRIVGMRESIAGKEMLLQRMKDTFDSLIPDKGDFKMIHDYEGKQKAIEDLEKEIKAEQGALEDLMGVLRDSSSKLNQLRTSVHKARMSQLKEERQLAVQNAQEEYQTLTQSVVEHEEVRKLLPESMLSNREFMQKYESSFRDRMLGEESDTESSLQALKDQMEAKDKDLKLAASDKEKAYEAFVAAPGTKTEAAYTQAIQRYATTYAEYTQLQRLKALEEKTLEAVEKGLDASQRATAVAESVADALEAKEIGKTLREDTQGLGDTIKGIESARSDELGVRLERLNEQPTWYNAFGRQRLMDDARTWGATSVEALEGQESLYQSRIGELQPTLTAEQAELADLEARHKLLLSESVDMETGEVLNRDKLAESKLVEQQIASKEQHIKGIEETIRKYEEHIERIKEGIDEIAEKLATYMQMSVAAAGKVTEQRMREETATKKHLLGKPWADYTAEDTQKFQELMQTPEMYWDESDYAFKRSFLADRRRDFDKAGKEKELEFFRTGSPEEIREYELKRRAGQTQDPIARKNAINRAYDEYENYQRKEQEMQAKIEFQNRARIAGGIGNLIGDMPGDMIEGMVLRPRKIEQRHEEKADDLEQHKRDRIADIRDNPLISKRQQDAQIERLEERHQERMRDLQKDTDKEKQKSFNSVVTNFVSGIGKMIAEEAQLRLARNTTNKVFEAFGWDEGGSGQVGALRATGSKSGVTLSDYLRQYFSDGGNTGGGGVPPGTMGVGGSSRSGGGGFSFNPSFKGVGRPSLPKVSGQGNNWLARALPKDKGGGGFLSGVADWWNSGYNQMNANIAATQGFQWQGLGSLFGSSGAGSLSAGLSTAASPAVLAIAAKMGTEAVLHSADVLNRTSGTGNWFTQSGKDIGGFAGEVFGGAANWLGDTFSFDNALNDRMARKIGAMQQVQAAKRQARKMGHSSAMDLLGEHAQGFQEEVDAMHKRQGDSMGVGGDQSLVANIQIVQEDGGRERVKKDEIQRVKLTKQNMLPTIRRR